jgi:hypothetical protein
MAAPTPSDDVESLHAGSGHTQFVADAPLSERDVALLAELRAAVAAVAVDPDDEAYWRGDHALHRFLVARNRNVRATAEMYTHTMAHRRKLRCGQLLAEYTQPEVMRKCVHTPSTRRKAWRRMVWRENLCVACGVAGRRRRRAHARAAALVGRVALALLRPQLYITHPILTLLASCVAHVSPQVLPVGVCRTRPAGLPRAGGAHRQH